MNEIATVAEMQTIIWAARDFKVVTSFDEGAQEKFRRAALSYYAYCRLHPGENRCRVALLVGAAHFDPRAEEKRKIDGFIAALQSPNRDAKLANIRQQLMAFARVISLEMPIEKRNSLKGIGRVFRRNHATVIYAVRKYGDAVGQALGMELR